MTPYVEKDKEQPGFRHGILLGHVALMLFSMSIDLPEDKKYVSQWSKRREKTRLRMTYQFGAFALQTV